MEITSQSLCSAKFPKPQSCSIRLSLLSLLSSLTPNLFPIILHPFFLKILPTSLQCVRIKSRQKRNSGAVNASEAESTATDDAERWLLHPVGDDDSRHIGFKVSMPGAFKRASTSSSPLQQYLVCMLRSGRRNGSPSVTDLDSTNGTFIDEKRLRPGVADTISSGDTHLAMFRVSKLSKSEESESKETEKSSENSETTS